MLLFDFQSLYKLFNNHFFNDNVELASSDEFQIGLDPRKTEFDF